MAPRPDRRAVEYIACEALRRYGTLEPDTADKLRRNVRRNFEVSMPRGEVLRLAEHYKKAYAFGASILPRFLTPPKGRYVDWADVRVPEFLAALKEEYPKESKYLIEAIGWYVGHYEYLR